MNARSTQMALVINIITSRTDIHGQIGMLVKLVSMQNVSAFGQLCQQTF